MKFLRTPERSFRDIGFEFEPHYVSITASDGTDLRMHYIDEGPQTGPLILCLHGQPSWSFLYRKMVEPLTSAGFRVIAPDLIGFGKSDKPVSVDSYSYAGHVDWMAEFIETLNLTHITGVFQDWGGSIGMRVVERLPDRFSRLVLANTMLLDTLDIPNEVSQALAAAYTELPMTSAEDVRDSFAVDDPVAGAKWVKYATENPAFSVRDVFSVITGITDEAALRGYCAPFPDNTYLAGPRSFPGIFPIMPHHKVEREENDRVWQELSRFMQPVLTAFSDGDPVTLGHDKNFRERMPGAKSVIHVTITNAGHYLQDDQPKQLTEAIINFAAET